MSDEVMVATDDRAGRRLGHDPHIRPRPDLHDLLRSASEAREAGRASEARTILESAAHDFPDSADVREHLARLAEAQQNWAEAERWWREFAALRPAARWTVNVIAHTISRQGRIADAEAWVAKALERSNDVLVFCYYAGMAEARRDWAEAESRWAVVVERFPGSWEGLAGQAKMWRQQGRADQARDLLEQAFDRFPTTPGPAVELARLSESRRDWPAAEHWWRKFLALQPGPLWGYIGLTHALREQGKIKDAEALLSAQFDRLTDEPGLFAEYARLAERSGNWTEAATRWEDVTKRFPANWQGYAGCSRVSREQGDAAAALMILTNAADRFPGRPEPSHDLARLAETDRDWVSAERWWRAHAAILPGSWFPPTQIAKAMRQQGRMAEADAYLANALARFPNDVQIFIEYARAAEAQRNWAEAQARWIQVAERFPDSWEGLTGHGRALRERGQLDLARDVLSQAVERFPTAVGPMVELARVATSARDWPAAERCWRSCVTLDPRLWWGYTSLATALQEQGKHTEADAVFTDRFQRFAHEPALFIEYARLADFSADWGAAIQRWTDVRDRFPDLFDGYAGLARAARENGDFPAAQQVLTEAFTRFPTRSAPSQELARLAGMQGAWKEAERWWRIFATQEPAQSRGFTGLANALAQQGRLLEAEAVLAGEFHRLSEDRSIFIDYARLAEKSGDWTRAAARWADVTDRFPAVWDGYAGQARALQELGRVGQAREILTGALPLFPGLVSPAHELARLAEAQRDWQTAERWWSAALQIEPAAGWVHRGLINVLREQGELEQAFSLAAEAVKVCAEDLQLFSTRAQLAELQKDWEEARSAWQLVCERFPASSTGPVGYANVLRQSGDIEGASDTLNAAIQRFPRNIDLLIHSANLAEQSGSTDLAVDFCERAIVLDRKNVGLYLHIFRIYARAKEGAKAEQTLDRALRVLGERADLLLESARVSYQKGDCVEAAAKFQKCREKYPSNIAAVVGLAQSLSGQGMHLEAEDLLSNELKSDPDNRELAVAYAQVPTYRGPHFDAEYQRRTKDLISKFPDDLEICKMMAQAFLTNNRDADAEAFLLERIQNRFTDKSLLHLLATALVRQRKWDAAVDVFESILRRYGYSQNTLKEYAGAMVSAKLWDRAQEVLNRLISKFPLDYSAQIVLFDVLIARDDIPGAIALWRDLEAKSVHAHYLRVDLFARRGQLVGLGFDPAAAGAPAPQATTVSDADDYPIGEIVTSFESLGGWGMGCEFGLFQRFYGAEPLGLLRWTEMRPEELADVLESEFEGIGSPDQTVLQTPNNGDHREYGASDRRFGMMMHTFVRADQVPPDKMFVQLCRRLTFLKGKLLGDLREGNKIFVYKNALRNLSDDEIDRIYKAIRRYGDTTLLYVRMQDEHRPFPLVESPKPGLMIGYIDQFVKAPDETRRALPAASWAAVATNAYRLWRNTSAVARENLIQ